MAIAEQPVRLMKSHRGAIYLAGALVILAVLFWDGLVDAWVRWGWQKELSHSYFIPLISAWLIWVNKDVIRQSIGAPSLWGLVIFIAAGLVLLLGGVTHIFVLQQIALIIAIAGFSAGYGGLSLLRVTAAPIAFLLFAVPPPYWVITVLSWKFQLMSSVLGVWMIELMDIPVYLSGNVIDLGEYKLQVAEACSGLRYLFPFLSLGVMTAYLYRGPLWQKGVVVLSTIPITIVMNSARVAVTGALVQAQGPEHAEGALHFFEGWVVFLLCLIALFGVIAALNALTRANRNALESLGAPEQKPVEPSHGKAPGGLAMAAIFGAAAAIFALSQLLSVDSLITPERKKFAGVPNEFPTWAHEVRPMDPTVAETLGADDTIVVNFQKPEGGVVNLYMAYLEAQRDGRSWHSPRQCIPGGGWRIDRHDIVETASATGEPFAYNRLIIQHQDAQQLVYYWYDQRGRKLANEFVMKFWLLFDAVAKRRSDGALVRLITPVTAEGGVEGADATLKATMREMEDFLPDYVPN